MSLSPLSLFLSLSLTLFSCRELLAFFVVNLVGGAVARRLVGTVDDKGYLLTTRDTWFKINYTRKLQHFLSCFLPVRVSLLLAPRTGQARGERRYERCRLWACHQTEARI